MRPIRIDDFHYLDSNFCSGDKTYEVQDLIKAAEDLEEFDLPLAAVNMKKCGTKKGGKKK